MSATNSLMTKIQSAKGGRRKQQKLYAVSKQSQNIKSAAAESIVIYQSNEFSSLETVSRHKVGRMLLSPSSRRRTTGLSLAQSFAVQSALTPRILQDKEDFTISQTISFNLTTNYLSYTEYFIGRDEHFCLSRKH